MDTDGIIRDHHFGEGRYEQSKCVIQQLLGVEAEADCDHLYRGRAQILIGKWKFPEARPAVHRYTRS